MLCYFALDHDGVTIQRVRSPDPHPQTAEPLIVGLDWHPIFCFLPLVAFAIDSAALFIAWPQAKRPAEYAHPEAEAMGPKSQALAP